MTHEIRDMEAHLKNVWQFDKWGFTTGLRDRVTLSDIDGFYAHFLETGYQFLIVEMKHWDGTGNCPFMSLASGQAIALKRLSEQRNFTVLLGYGDTSTQTVHHAEVWNNGQVHQVNFKEALGMWWGYHSVKG
jgi:hypothetical protein